MTDNTNNNEAFNNTPETNIPYNYYHKSGKPESNWFKILMIIIVSLILISNVLIFSSQIVQIPDNKWEYKIVEIYPDENNSRDGNGAFNFNSITPSEEQLDALGEQGWELVTSYVEVETAFPNFGNDEYVTGIRENIRPQRLVLIFKRPI